MRQPNAGTSAPVPKPKPAPKPTYRPEGGPGPTTRTITVKAHPQVQVHIHVHPSPDAQDVSSRSPAQKQKDRAASNRNIQQARGRVQARTYVSQGQAVSRVAKQLDKGTAATHPKHVNLIRPLKQALSGKGPIVRADAKLAHTVAPVTAGLVPGGNLPGVGTLIKHSAEDLANLPAQAVPSVYVPAAGAYEAAKGRPQRLNQFRHDLAKSDPFYNLGAAGVAKIRGQDKQASLHLKRAEKSVVAHPGYAALEAYGLKGSLGRGVGRVMRSGVIGSAAKAAASTVREPKVLPGTSLREQRTYSPDVIRKAEQVNRERRLRRTSAETTKRAQAEPNPERRAELEQKARSQNPDLIRERDINRRVDKTVAAAEVVRRRHRVEAVQGTRKLIKPVRKAGPILSLVSQRIATANVGDLRAYMRELEAEHANLGLAGKRANETMRHQLGKAIKRAESGKLDLSQVKQVADEFAHRGEQAQRGLVSRGMLDAAQVQRRQVMPYAVRKLDAEHVTLKGEEGSTSALMARTGKHADYEKALTAVEDAKDVVKAMRVAKDKEAIAAASVKLKEARAAVEPAKAEAYRELPTSEIQAHMAKRGETPGAYISQAPNARGAGNFYRSSHQPPNISNARFTGKATRSGTFSGHPETLVETSARSQALRDQFDHFQRFLQEFGHKSNNPKSRGGFVTKASKAKANELAANLTVAHGMKWRAIRVNPFGASKEQLHAMLEGDTSKPNAVTDAVLEALDGKGNQGPWAIVPEAAASRMQEHVRLMAPGNAGRVARMGSSLFRQTVLATSPKWFINNAVEAGFRSALARAGPRSYVTGRRYLAATRQLDPAEAEFTQARTVGGGHYAMAERLKTHTDIEQFTDGGIRDVARGLGAFWRLPGPKQAAAIWHGWTHFVFNTANAYVEHQFQTAMLGKAVRDQLMPDELRKLSQKAIDQAAAGHHDVNTIVALGDAVDRMYGRYDKFRPAEKQAIALYTPFIAWAMNAAYFVMRTLPQDHPTALAVLASTQRATEQWRRSHGLDEFMKGRVPGFLQGSIPAHGNVKYRAPTNSLPFGAFSDLPSTAASAVLPQLSGVLSAFQGRDWKGKELRDKHGQPMSEIARAGVAASQFLQSTVPILAVRQQVQKGLGGQGKSVSGYTVPKARKVKATVTSAGSGLDMNAPSGGLDMSAPAGSLDMSGG